MRHFRAICGGVVWLAIAVGLWWNHRFIFSSGTDHALLGLKRFWCGSRPTARLQLPMAVDLEVGDPILVRDQSGALRQVGEVHALLQEDRVAPTRRARTSSVQIFLFPTAPECTSEAEFTYFGTPDSLAWVVSTLLTPKRKELIIQEIRTAYEQNRAELWASLEPLLERTLQDGFAVIEQDLPGVIEHHSDEIEALGAKYEREIISRELLPLAKREIWPIVQRRAVPLMDEVGMELWERVSLWRFGWRAAYDRSPLPDKHLLEQEWQRFVRDAVMPILSKHTGDMIDVVRGVIQDAAANEEVKAAARRSLSRVATDPEFQQLVFDIIEEAFIFNPHLREVVERHWTGPDAQQAIQLASDRLEPAVRRIADLLFGSFEQGITPEFAQVLRTTILLKDQRWFLLDPKPAGMRLDGDRHLVFSAQIADERVTRPAALSPRSPVPARLETEIREMGEGS